MYIITIGMEFTTDEKLKMSGQSTIISVGVKKIKFEENYSRYRILYERER